MTRQEIIIKAIDSLNKVKGLGIKIISIHDFSSYRVELSLSCANIDRHAHDFSFSDSWFDITRNPLSIDDEAHLTNINDQDKRCILRIAYYLFFCWYKPNKKP